MSPEPREACRRIEVALRRAGLGVGDRERVLDVRECAVVDPMVPVVAAAVDQLEDQLDVGVVEEPEVAGVAGDRDGRCVAGAAGEVGPSGRHLEPRVLETEVQFVRPAGGPAIERQRPELDAVLAVLRGEIELVSDHIELGRLRRFRPGRDVVHHPSAGSGPVGNPELATVIRITSYEVGAISPMRQRASRRVVGGGGVHSNWFRGSVGKDPEGHAVGVGIEEEEEPFPGAIPRARDPRRCSGARWSLGRRFPAPFRPSTRSPSRSRCCAR